MMRKILSLALCLALCLALLPAAQAANTGTWTDSGNYVIDWYGDGSALSYTISTAAQLAGLAAIVSGLAFGDAMKYDKFMGKTVTLTADIDLTGHDWTPIGGKQIGQDEDFYAFNGTFEADGHAVRGMTVKESVENFTNGGFFGYVGIEGYVRNLAVFGSVEETSTWNNNSGGLVGENGGVIENCSHVGTVVAKGNGPLSAVGGIAGNNYVGKILNCWHSGSLSVTSGWGENCVALGGVAGYNSYGKVQNCYYDSKTAGNAVGGSGSSSASFSGCAAFSDSGALTAVDGTDEDTLPDAVVGASTTLLAALNAYVASGQNDSTLRYLKQADSSAAVYCRTIAEALAVVNPDITDQNIDNALDLAKLAVLVAGGEDMSGLTYTQTADIGLGLYSAWTPVGTADHAFAGSYAGGGHAIAPADASGNLSSVLGGYLNLSNLFISAGGSRTWYWDEAVPNGSNRFAVRYDANGKMTALIGPSDGRLRFTWRCETDGRQAYYKLSGSFAPLA